MHRLDNCIHKFRSSLYTLASTQKPLWQTCTSCGCWPAAQCIWGHPDWPSILWGAGTVPLVRPRSSPRSTTLRCPEGPAACQSPGCAKWDSENHIHMMSSSKGTLTPNIKLLSLNQQSDNTVKTQLLFMSDESGHTLTNLMTQCALHTFFSNWIILF